MPICLGKAKFNPKRDYEKCACRGTKVDGKCMFGELCKKEAVVYKVTDQPTGFSYIGKAQGGLGKRINAHVNGLKAFWNLREKYKKYTTKTASNKFKLSTPRNFKPRRTSSISTPICSQELSQTPDQQGVSALVKFMSEYLTPSQKSISNDEPDSETEMSESDESESEFSQILTPTPFQREFGIRSTEKNPKKREEEKDFHA